MIEVGDPVVLEVADGLVVDLLAHLPADRRRIPTSGGGEREERLSRVLRGWVGTRVWPALCGRRGWIYLYDGPLVERQVCAECAARAPSDPPDTVVA